MLNTKRRYFYVKIDTSVLFCLQKSDRKSGEKQSDGGE